MYVLPNIWEFASVISKFFLYVSVASIAGGSFSLLFFHDDRRLIIQRHLIYILVGSLLGFHAVVFYFLFQIGLINDAGLAGILDWDMAQFLFTLPLGEATLLRLGGFILALLGSVLLLRYTNQLNRAPGRNFYRIIINIAGISLVVIALSFQVTGHVSQLSLTAQAAITVHVIAIALWLGTLFPLYSLSNDCPLERLQLTMKRFGYFAIYIVALLVSSGSLMLLQLFESPVELLSSVYGRSVMIKLILVLALLLFAGLNKVYLVPHLISGNSIEQLRKSIKTEMLVGTLILLVTSYFSTVVGPAEH
jgi:putative copper resistance protein D